MNINLDKRFFNPNFYWAIRVLGDSMLRYGFFYGGSSSGKTYSLVQAILISTLKDGCNSIIFRKTGASLRRSIYNDFIQVIKSMHLEDYFEVQMLNIKCSNGAHIAFAGLDSPEKIKGISTYKRIMVDEITELEPEDFQQLRKRMRGMADQTLLATFNPIDITHWLKASIFDSLDLKTQSSCISNNPLTQVTEVQRADNYIFVKSTYQNNFWVVGSPDKSFGYLDLHTIADFEKDKKADINFYNVYALGEWGRMTQGGEFYKNFKRETHCKSVKLDETLPLHISIDENVRPYFPMVIMQTQNNEVRVLDEICGKSPNNNVLSVVKQFAAKYARYKTRQIYLYGDATSRRHDARTENGFNLFGIMTNELKALGFQVITQRVPSANPSVSMSGTFINRILSGVTPYSILVDPSCANTITDFMYLKEDKDGGMLKERAKDKSDGTSYEKYGHCSDAVRYMVLSYLKEDYDKFTGKGHSIDAFTIDFKDDKFIF